MKKKIILVYDFLKELGGIERVMFFQAKALSKLYDVSLLFTYLSEKDSLKIKKEFDPEDKLKIYSLGKRFEVIQYFLSLFFPSRINKFSPDLFITHSFISSLMAYKRKVKANIPYIVMIHHPPNLLYERKKEWVNNFPRFLAYVAGGVLESLLKKWDRIAVKNSDLVLVNSKYTAERIKKIYNIDPVIIYPPITEKFRPIKLEKAKKILEKIGIKKDYILLHGRIIKDKRPDFGLKAFAEIIKNYKFDLDLVISGTIEEKEKIEKLASKLGIEDRIKIIGKVSEEELVSLYNCAKCFLMTAPKEDFGLTSVEAIACGCPVVAWGDDAGPQEIIKNNVNGFLAEPYNIKDYSKKIEMCLRKKWEKKKISESVKKFSQKEIEKKLLKIVINYLK